ncbi:hypothetical protein C8F04DRAFT_1194062 [Mycena alexandri]|uniref:Uncharacterized protein n=1 Tax=Mycena alexandri TaxID=1745969 RepID=A0AAD6S8M3_9AGAR|nr:hypothetical protein C8F04DRAFT_1194062 [Mycena alexandri]
MEGALGPRGSRAKGRAPLGATGSGGGGDNSDCGRQYRQETGGGDVRDARVGTGPRSETASDSNGRIGVVEVVLTATFRRAVGRGWAGREWASEGQAGCQIKREVWSVRPRCGQGAMMRMRRGAVVVVVWEEKENGPSDPNTATILLPSSHHDVLRKRRASVLNSGSTRLQTGAVNLKYPTFAQSQRTEVFANSMHSSWCVNLLSLPLRAPFLGMLPRVPFHVPTIHRGGVFFPDPLPRSTRPPRWRPVHDGHATQFMSRPPCLSLFRFSPGYTVYCHRLQVLRILESTAPHTLYGQSDTESLSPFESKWKDPRERESRGCVGRQGTKRDSDSRKEGGRKDRARACCAGCRVTAQLGKGSKSTHKVRAPYPPRSRSLRVPRWHGVARRRSRAVGAVLQNGAGIEGGVYLGAGNAEHGDQGAGRCRSVLLYSRCRRTSSRAFTRRPRESNAHLRASPRLRTSRKRAPRFEDAPAHTEDEGPLRSGGFAGTAPRGREWRTLPTLVGR